MDRMKLGSAGEEMAASYLEALGHKILERRYRNICGEIDIISYFDKAVYFVEVKTRSGLRYGRPAEAVNKNKIRHIRNVATMYLERNPIMDREDLEYKIEVVEILVNELNVE